MQHPGRTCSALLLCICFCAASAGCSEKFPPNRPCWDALGFCSRQATQHLRSLMPRLLCYVSASLGGRSVDGPCMSLLLHEMRLWGGSISFSLCLSLSLFCACAVDHETLTADRASLAVGDFFAGPFKVGRVRRKVLDKLWPMAYLPARRVSIHELEGVSGSCSRVANVGGSRRRVVYS